MDRSKGGVTGWSTGSFRSQPGTGGGPNAGAAAGTAAAARGADSLTPIDSSGRFSGGGAFTPGGGSYDVVLAPGSSAQGKLELKGRALVNARVEGELSNDVELVVGEQGDIEGNLNGTAICVFGRVKGDINCSARLELRSGASVTGNLASPSLIIEDGVVFDGHCRMWDARGAAGQELPPSSADEDDFVEDEPAGE